MDPWTKIALTITFQGTQNSKTRMGDCSISLKPALITTVKTGFFQRYFWWLYYQLHYKNQRIIEFYRAKSIFNTFKLRIAQVYGIEAEESL